MTGIVDVVRPYRVTRTQRLLGLYPIRTTTWEAELLLSDVYYADTQQKSLHRTYARNALLVMLEATAPRTMVTGIRWGQLTIEHDSQEVVS